VHSMSEPFEEDPTSQVADDVLKNWLAHFGMNWHQLHASGHASKSEIMDIIEGINPKTVFPVHTLNAEIFKESNDHVKIPEKNNRVEM